MEFEEKHQHDHKNPNEVELDYKSLHIKCNNCGSDVPANDVNIFRTIAKCQECDNIFDFTKKEDEQWARRRPEMLIPEGMEVLKLRSELDISTKWYHSVNKKGMGMFAVFALLWNAMLLPFILGSVFAGDLSVLLFASVHIIVGLGMLGKIASSYLNTTNILVTKKQIEVKHSPIRMPGFGNKIYETKDIKQLYVSRYVSSRTNGISNHAYALYAILKNGKKIELVKGMNKETQQYLEQEIELFLDITDYSVRGETK